MEIKFWGAKLTKPDVQADFSKGESCICMSSPRDKEYARNAWQIHLSEYTAQKPQKIQWTWGTT